MRRAAGIVLGLSVVGCQGLQPGTRYQMVQMIPLGQPGMSMPQQQIPPAMPSQAPGMLPPVHPQPQGGTVSYPQGQAVPFPQPMPQGVVPMQGEPPLAPMGPSTMGSVDPNMVAMLQARAQAAKMGLPPMLLGEDSEAKRMQMELTKEMVQQIVELRKKVAELSAESQRRNSVGHTKATPIEEEVAPSEPIVEKPTPAPKVAPVVKKPTPVTQILHEAPAPMPVKPRVPMAAPTTPVPVPVTTTAAVAPTPAPASVPVAIAAVAPAAVPAPVRPVAPVIVMAPPPSPEEVAARQLQMELTRELGRQVIDLKQKVGDLRSDVESWADAGREKRKQEMNSEVLDLRIQIVNLQEEMAKLKAPEKASEPPRMPIPQELLVPPPEGIMPVLPAAPINPLHRPTVSENTPASPQEYPRRFADALSEIRTDLEELKACFLYKLVPADTDLALELLAGNR